MDEAARSPDDFASAFENAFARLQVCVEESCAGQGDWVDGIAVAIGAALRLAASDPGAANVLTNEALTAGTDGMVRHGRLLAYVAYHLASGRDLPQVEHELPGITEQALAGGLVGLVAERLAHGRASELPDLAPGAIQFALTPYLGVGEATRVAERFGWPRSQPDR